MRLIKTMSEKGLNILNIIIFKIVWLTCVIYQNTLVGVCVILVVLNFLVNKQYVRNIKIIAGIALLGIFIDISLSITGIFIFHDKLIPLWLILLWFQFALSIPYGLQIFSTLPLLTQVFIGGVAGVGSYWFGMKMGSVEFGYSTLLTVMIIAGLWGFMLPVFYWYSGKVENV